MNAMAQLKKKKKLLCKPIPSHVIGEGLFQIIFDVTKNEKLDLINVLRYVCIALPPL